MPQSHDIDRIARADVIRLSSYRPDGSRRPAVTIWVVGSQGTLYVRSAYGTAGGWYQRALRGGTAHIEGGGATLDVRLEPVTDDAARDEVAAAYREKYGAQAGSLATMLEGPAAETTTRLTPIDG